MTRFIRALLWIRWRALLNSVGSRSRDEAERLARIGNLLIRLVLMLVFVPTALVLSAAAFVGGNSMLTDEPTANAVDVTTRAILFAVTVAVLFGPLLRTVGGIEPELRRLLLMPIPRRALHLADAVSSVLDPWIVPPLLALTMIPLGLAAAGAPSAAAIAMLAAAAFCASMLALGSAAASIMVALFRDRQRAEWISITLVLVLMCAGFVPGLIDDGATDGTSGEVGLEAVVAWLAPFPSEQLGATLRAVVGGDLAEALGRTGIAWLTAVLLFAGSARLHSRILDGVENGGRRRRGSTGRRRDPRIPFVSGQRSEIAMTLVRTSLRTVRGRIGVSFAAIMLGLIWLGTRAVFAEGPARWMIVQGPLLFAGGALFAALTLQPLMLNQFAVDGPGLALSVLTPVTSRELVRGKLLGHLLLAGLAVALCLIVTIALVRAGDPRFWLAATLAALTAFVTMIPIGTLLSIVLPKASDLSRIGRDGNPHQLAGLLGGIVSGLIFGLANALWIVPGVLLGRPWLGCAFATVGLALSWLFAWPASNLAARLFDRRRENLCLVASGR